MNSMLITYQKEMKVKLIKSAFVSLVILSGTGLSASENSVPEHCYKILNRMCTMNYDPATCTYSGLQHLNPTSWKGSNKCEAIKQLDFFVCTQQENIFNLELYSNVTCDEDRNLIF